MKNKILQDTKEAMRAKDELRLLVLRMISAAIHNKELEKRAKTGKIEELMEEETVAVIRFEVKKRRDAIVEFEKGGRKDLVEKETAELKVLERYVPQELSDDEVKKNIQDVIEYLGDVSSKDFGRVMGEAMKLIKGQATGDRVAALVRTMLGA